MFVSPSWSYRTGTNLSAPPYLFQCNRSIPLVCSIYIFSKSPFFPYDSLTFLNSLLLLYVRPSFLCLSHRHRLTAACAITILGQLLDLVRQLPYERLRNSRAHHDISQRLNEVRMWPRSVGTTIGNLKDKKGGRTLEVYMLKTSPASVSISFLLLFVLLMFRFLFLSYMHLLSPLNPPLPPPIPAYQKPGGQRHWRDCVRSDLDRHEHFVVLPNASAPPSWSAFGASASKLKTHPF